MDGWQTILTIGKQYGLSTAISVAMLSMFVWLLRLSIKNPVDAYAQVIQDMETMRQAMRVELEAQTLVIDKLRQEAEVKDQLIAELRKEIAQLQSS